MHGIIGVVDFVNKKAIDELLDYSDKLEGLKDSSVYTNEQIDHLKEIIIELANLTEKCGENETTLYLYEILSNIIIAFITYGPDGRNIEYIYKLLLEFSTLKAFRYADESGIKEMLDAGLSGRVKEQKNESHERTGLLNLFNEDGSQVSINDL